MITIIGIILPVSLLVQQQEVSRGGEDMNMILSLSHGILDDDHFPLMFFVLLVCTREVYMAVSIRSRSYILPLAFSQVLWSGCMTCHSLVAYYFFPSTHPLVGAIADNLDIKYFFLLCSHSDGTSYKPWLPATVLVRSSGMLKNII
jgi:hypothetical protein